MIGYVVPHTLYPDGYHCNPKLPVPFINIASQKNFIALYHTGIYADSELLKWFTDEFPKHSNQKLDMGKSCIRFKKLDQIPFHLIAQLVQKVTVEEWINTYETNQEVKIINN
jgi:beta-glucanase (GH16 family)